MTPRLDYPDERECRWLVNQGVDPDSLTTPWPIRAAKVRWLSTMTFDFDAAGERALVFPEAQDLIAWQPRTGKLASWHGCTFCLGDVDDIFNPGTFFAEGALRIHADPLHWLRANRTGIVILRTDLTYAYLRHCPRLVFADQRHAERVWNWIQPPMPTAELLVEVREELAA